METFGIPFSKHVVKKNDGKGMVLRCLYVIHLKSKRTEQSEEIRNFEQGIFLDASNHLPFLDIWGSGMR